MNNELKAVKVVLFCAAAQDSADSAYGDRGFIGRDLARMADVPIEYRGFGGLLKGDARSEFLAAANDADVVLLDAWCNSQLYPDCERPQRDMANNAERIKADNPRAFVLAELMEGVHKVAVHEVATPFVDWTDPEVIAAIKLASRLKNMDSETLILVVDDDERNLAAAKKQLVNLGLLLTANSYLEAIRLIKAWDFDWVLTDLMMPGDRINQGKGLEFVGQLGDYGNYVAWAALAKGVKHIGIVSDTGHHDHPAGHIAEIMPSTPQMKWFCGYHCPKIDMPDIPGGSVKNWAMAFSES